MDLGLVVLDVSDPTAPEPVSRVYLQGGWASDLALHGDYVCVSGWEGAVHVIDVSDLAAPVILGRYTAPGPAYGIDATGDFAYVAYSGVSSDPGGLLVLDISDPTNITFAGKVNTEWRLMKVRVRGDYAYAVGDCDLWIIDVSVPTEPSLVAQFFTGDCPLDLDIREDDTLVYLADNDLFDPPGLSAFTIVNVADPESPFVAARRVLRGPVGDVALSGDLAFVADPDYGMFVYDVSDPLNPDSIGAYYVFSGAVAKIAVADTVAFLVDYIALGSFYSGRLHVVDVRDPSNVQPLGEYHLPGEVNSVTVSGDYVYTCNNVDADREDVAVVDVTHKDNPRVVGTYSTPGSGQGAVVVDTLLYLAGGSTGLEIINVADPAEPQLLGSHAACSGAVNVVVVGQTAFVAGSSGLWIFDVSDPENPQLIGNGETPGSAESVALLRDYAYVSWIVTYSSSAIDIFDISDLAHPSYISTFGTYGSIYTRVAILDNITLAARTSYGMQLFDITDPENPVYGGYAFTGSDIRDFTFFENYVLVSKGWGGISIFDISDPDNAYQVASYDTPGMAVGAIGDSAHVYVADRWGLIVLECGTPTPVAEPDPGILPETFVLHQNYPNPFNPVTTIEYELPCRSDVTLSIHNVLGRKVAVLVCENKAAGVHEIQWDAGGFASGIYFYRLEAGDVVETRKMTLVK
jgi:hypothetical protein